MRNFKWHSGMLMLGVLLSSLLTAPSSRADDAEGVARISDRGAGVAHRVRQVSLNGKSQAPGLGKPQSVHTASATSTTNCAPACTSQNCNECNKCEIYCDPCYKPCCLSRLFGCDPCDPCCNQCCLCRLFCCGYLGGHDEGIARTKTPLKFGRYKMVYAADPYYADPRDSRVYAAEGYGLPMTVPLAPNVEHEYNYGWGIPSSRLTPVSKPPQMPIRRPVPYLGY